jgi:ribonuclease T
MTTTSTPEECFISVDIETSGPVPEMFSMLSIGACVIDKQHQSTSVSEHFYCTLKPLPFAGVEPEALNVSGLSMKDLVATGLEPIDAMQSFADWIAGNSGQAQAIFVGLNAAFDWSFINYYFHRFLGKNPFGFSALDIKALFMGATGCGWVDTRSSRMSEALGLHQVELSHHALEDAKAQAELFRVIRQGQQSN